MKAMLTALIIMSANFSVASFAAPLERQHTEYTALHFVRPNFHRKNRSDILPVHDRRVFLGCVYSYHECEHLGHDRGFMNHSTQHNHRICHHGPSYACYGR
jgi:hypothetical protein